MDKLKVCMVSAVQTSFWGSSRNQYINHFVPKMESIAQNLGFELNTVKEPIPDGKSAVKVKKEIENQGFDFLLVQVSTFSAGDIIEPLAETGIRLGLWGLPEITSDGPIPLNSFCGMNMFGSIIHQYIDRSLKYKWFYGDVDDDLFIERFKVTIKALTAIKKLNNAKAALVGGIAPGFNDLYFDERKTKSKLGVKVDRLHEYLDIRDEALGYKTDEIQNIVEEMKKEACCVSKYVNSEALENTARVYKAFEDFLVDNGYDAVAISCWPKYRRDFGIVVCSVIGRLLDKGYIAACEGDVDSSISMLLLHYLTGEMPMLMDMSRVDFNDESVLVWHCGSAPGRYADSKGMRLDAHYKPGSRLVGEDNIKVGTANDLYFKPQEVTVARFTDEYERMFTFTGEFIDKKDRGFDGSRGWIGNLKIDGEKVSLKDFVNTLMVQGFQHHYPIVSGNVEKELMEVMSWLDIKPLPIVKYRDYLQNPQY